MIIIDTIGVLRSLYDDFKNRRVVRKLRRLSDEEKCRMHFSERYVELLSTSDVSDWLEQNLLPSHIGVVTYTPSDSGCSLVQLMVNDEKDVGLMKRVAFVYALNLSIELKAMLSSKDNIIVVKNNNNQN